VYAFAHAQGWIASNPALRLATVDMPSSEITFGAVLTPAVYEACLQVLPPIDGTPIEIRDRAMFLLLLNLGVTPQEVRELTLRSLERDELSGRVLYLRIAAIRSQAQQRRVAVDHQTSEALSQWLVVRDKIKGSADAGAQGLFVSQKSPYVTMGMLLHVCRSLILRACAKVGQPPPAKLGPQTLRNTAIVRWLDDGIDCGVVARMAGLKNAKGLRHLNMHVGQDVRAHLALADKRDDAIGPSYPSRR
jgi:site-specific recombinase XerD